MIPQPLTSFQPSFHLLAEGGAHDLVSAAQLSSISSISPYVILKWAAMGELTPAMEDLDGETWFSWAANARSFAELSIAYRTLTPSPDFIP